MRKILFPILALFLCCCASAQNSEADSIKRLLLNPKEDHDRVMNLEALSYAYLSSFPDTSLHYAQEGLTLAQKINDAVGESACIIALGNVYFHFGDYGRSLEMYLQALKMKEKIKGANFAVTYFNIADVYITQEDFEHGLQYLRKAIADDKRRKDTSGILFDLYSLGTTYHRMKKYDSALLYSQQALDLCRQLNDQDLVGAVLNNFAAVHSEQRNYPAAISYYHQSIAASLNVNDNETLAEDYHGLATIYQEKQRPDSAKFYAYKALELAQAAPFLKQVVDISGFLANLYEGQKRYDSAYKYFRLSTATKDSLFNVEEVKKIQNLKFTEQQRQQAKETAENEYHQKVKLYAVLIASAILLVVAIVLLRNIRQKQKAYLLLQEQKQKTEEALQYLKAAQAQLIHTEKMASLGELTAGIAHEIQNPLNFINNFSELSVELANELKEEIENASLPEKQKQPLADAMEELADNQEKIHHHGKRASTIVKSMLQHSRRSEGQKEQVDINSLADEYLRLSYHGFRAKDKDFNATLKTQFDDNAGQIAVVRQDIGRVLLNLFNNAFYAVNEKKKQLNGTFEPEVSVTTRKAENALIIEVKDNGTGMPQNTLNKIFQPFFTTKPTGEGTGLGLSLSYDIVTKGHNGELTVETEEGKGTAFTVRLPLS